MSAAVLEKFLAQLYVDEGARARFLRNPREAAEIAGLGEEECSALENIDRLGLELAADSFAKKRAQARRQTKVKKIVLLGRKLARYRRSPV